MDRRTDQLPDSYWWEFMLDTYATTQAVAVRRQADTHKDVASLGKLMVEVRDDAMRESALPMGESGYGVDVLR